MILDKEQAKKKGLILLERVKGLDFRTIKMNPFEEIRDVVDETCLYIKKASRLKGVTLGEKRYLEAVMLAIKLGGKIPVEALLEKKNELFCRFIRQNHLQHRFFVLRLQCPFQKGVGVLIPISIKGNLTWVPFSSLKGHVNGVGEFYLQERKVFETDSFGVLLSDYATLCHGITESKEGKFLPYDYQDSSEWGGKYLLEICTVAMKEPRDKPSMLRRTHAYFYLKSKEGEMRSCGQDVLRSVRDASVREIFSRKEGPEKIMVPDPYTFSPKTAIQKWKAQIEITKEAHDKIIEIVERDRQSKGHIVSLLRGNCVCYVSKILKEGIGLNIDPKMHAVHIFGKEFIPNKLYRKIYNRVGPWYEKLPEWAKHMIFFFPLIYIPLLCIGAIATCLKRGDVDGKSDLYMTEVVTSPWTLSCPHPLQLQRELEKKARKKEFGIVITKSP